MILATCPRALDRSSSGAGVDGDDVADADYDGGVGELEGDDEGIDDDADDADDDDYAYTGGLQLEVHFV